MGIISSVKGAISSSYNKLDSALGGKLPGGVSPPASKATTSTTTTSSTTKGPQSIDLGKAVQTWKPSGSPASTPVQQKVSTWRPPSGGGGGGAGVTSAPSPPMSTPTSLTPRATTLMDEATVAKYTYSPGQLTDKQLVGYYAGGPEYGPGQGILYGKGESQSAYLARLGSVGSAVYATSPEFKSSVLQAYGREPTGNYEVNKFGSTQKFGLDYFNGKANEQPLVLRGLTKEESFFSNIAASKTYGGAMKLTEPFRIVGGGIAGLGAFGLGFAFNPIFGFGRNVEDQSQTGKLARGGLMFGKVTALSYNPITGIPTAAFFGTSAVRDISSSPVGFAKITYEYVKQEPYEFLGGLTGAKAGTTAGKLSLFGEKPYQFTPSPALEQATQPFSRQRATVLLKTEAGKYVLGKTKSGDIISIGGGVEKGQTPRIAALTELRQETGLGLKDITGFKNLGKVVTPEETFHVFTAGISKQSFSKIVPASDINRIVTISPSNPFIKGSTGQTALQPISRFSLFPFGRVRSYEAGLINFAETGVKPTWLGIDTKMGSYILGTQSRYNVPFSSQKQYMDIGGEQLFAHGTAEPAALRIFYPFEKSATVIGEKTLRGQAQGLYLQPQVNVKNQLGYIGLSYAKIFKTTQKSEPLNFKFGLASKPTFNLFKERMNGAIQPTPKTFSGAESEFILKPGTEYGTKGRATIASIGLKKVYLQPSKVMVEGSGGKLLSDIGKESSYRYIDPSKIGLYFGGGKSSQISSQLGLPKSSINLKSSLLKSDIISINDLSYKPSSSLTSNIPYKKYRNYYPTQKPFETIPNQFKEIMPRPYEPPPTSIIEIPDSPPRIPKGDLFPRLPEGLLQEYAPRKTKGRSYKRVPSIAAEYFGYKSTTAAPLEIGGFITRPILVSPKRGKGGRRK